MGFMAFKSSIPGTDHSWAVVSLHGIFYLPSFLVHNLVSDISHRQRINEI